jgi:hypothetical protein
MKQKKVIIGLASVLILTVVVIGSGLSRRRAGEVAVGLSLVGDTNANGTNMALFKVQNNQSRRIWLRHCYYFAGEAFREPAGAWQCSDQAASNRWGKSSMDLRQYLPPEPTRNSPDPTNLIIPVPTNQPLWRIGVTVEFNITLPTRIRSAWKPRDWWMLNPHQFINNSPEAIWVESPVITNAQAFPDGAASTIRAQLTD